MVTLHYAANSHDKIKTYKYAITKFVPSDNTFIAQNVKNGALKTQITLKQKKFGAKAPNSYSFQLVQLSS